MNQPDTPNAPESPEAIREDIEATRQRLQTDLETLEERVMSTFSLETVRTAIRENPLPWMIAGLGVGGLVLGYAIRQVRAPAPPPLPPRGTRRHAIARTARVAEEEGLIHPELRAIIVSLLTVEGLRWLRHYLAERAQRTSSELAERATPVVEQARERTMTAAERAQEQMRQQTERLTHRATSVRDGRQSRLRNWLPGR